ncbi:unnamed protein product [Bemisia tabaci]|uniref:SH2 domain-containing protein n=1 Tax=Bemisia tabaci TaxID=7038 RepID=A0A9P0A1S6_BEMTA|nr:PREDICTED: SH2 domain-containing protein 4B-like [Bemisia tabaci]XP_018901169.1 PREDICTED: SH2 domain-containing protein 4B-like [Bemisia tabaci]XP_018901170.1 PREDICTED: SH2 domain-containing protein 4B-like [Bemisia tabaci]CAH0382183.1 unnamed protein product [Bemisia tabaci]
MLQQILKDMYVDPDLLAELDEEQRHTLWCRMREEQVRRWKIWDQQHPPIPPRPPNPGKKKVQWRTGNDGNEWVWVMGEHPDDKSIEEILEEEAREAARKLAVKETEQLRLSVDMEIKDLNEDFKKNLLESKPKESSHGKLDDIFCAAVQGGDNPKKLIIPMQVSEKRDVLQELSLNKAQNVSERVKLWEQKVMDERTSVIFKNLQRKKQEAVREAEEASQKQEKVWREQEQKAKKAETQKREIARRAREEHRRSSIIGINIDLKSAENNTIPAVQPLPSPFLESPSPLTVDTQQFDFNDRKTPTKEAIIQWYQTSEFPRGTGLTSDRTSVAPWFHGLITRQEAESLLSTRPVGSFLVRLSEKIWGYAISYRAVDRYKHYLIDVSPSHYQFFGANQLSHNSLCDLIQYHQKHPITIRGGEILYQSCQRNIAVPIILQDLMCNLR